MLLRLFYLGCRTRVGHLDTTLILCRILWLKCGHFLQFKNQIWVKLIIQRNMWGKKRSKNVIKVQKTPNLQNPLQNDVWYFEFYCYFLWRCLTHNTCLLVYYDVSPYPCPKIGQCPRVPNFHSSQVRHSDMCRVRHSVPESE